MSFAIPEKEILAKLGVAGLEDLRAVADSEITEIRASVTRETITDEQAERIVLLASFMEDVDAQISQHEKRGQAYDMPVPQRAKAEAVEASAPATAIQTPVASPEYNDSGVKDVSTTTTVPVVDGQQATIVEASVTAAGSVTKDTPRSVGVADAAPYAPLPDIRTDSETDDRFTINAAATLSLGSRRGTLENNQATDMQTIALAMDEAARSHVGRATTGAGRGQQPIARITRNATESQVIMDRDDHDSAFGKLKALANSYGRDALEAANPGWCAPSPPDYSICSPITADGLLSAPEMVLNRGGLLHNQGLDFADFFGGDFVLPIPGYNILTEAEVIAGSPTKTCVDIPCPTFVDDRLNVAALCLTGSLLQNRGYPEFVRTFTDGAMAAMAHLVNREIINAIQTASTTVPLAAAVPWSSDGTVLSQVLSAVEMAVMDMRYAYRTRLDQRFDVVFPYWLLAQLRADYIRGNARANDDLATEAINAMFARRGAIVQWVYDWQDAFNPGALLAANQAGHATPITSLPFALTFLVYLPGTWVIGRQDVIRLDLVYDSTKLATNQVTQVFVEDGWKPMQMCPLSRDYTINICPSGSTGDQRLVSCV